MALGLAALERPMPQRPRASGVPRLPGLHRALQRLKAALEQPEAPRALLAELQVLRACLAGLPEGNPELARQLPTALSEEPLLRAYQEATVAVVEAKLAACHWAGPC